MKIIVLLSPASDVLEKPSLPVKISSVASSTDVLCNYRETLKLIGILSECEWPFANVPLKYPQNVDMQALDLCHKTACRLPTCRAVKEG